MNIQSVYSKKQITQAIDYNLLIAEIEKGFILYSQKQTDIAPVSFLRFQDPPADVHIKAGTSREDPYYVVKIASGFYDNPKIGLSSSNGLMLLFSKNNGQLEAVLLDEGQLTDVRTGLAGAIAAKHLAKHPILQIGLIGTGIQAKEQLYSLQYVTNCRDVLLWGRNMQKAALLAQHPSLSNFNIRLAKSIEELASECDLIVTATASTKPLLFGHQLRPGVHVTAVGADSKGKQELDPTVFAAADVISVDSISQCSEYGDLAYARHLDIQTPIELGKLIAQPKQRLAKAITVTDLTGVAIQDLQIAKVVYQSLRRTVCPPGV